MTKYTRNSNKKYLKKHLDNGELYVMRIRGTDLSQILLGLALLAALMWNLAYGAEVRWVQMDAGAEGTRAEIGLDAAAEYKILRLSNPARLAVDFPASRLGARFALPSGMGVVRAVRKGQPVPGTVRIVFDLETSVAAREPRIERGAEGASLVIEWPGEVQRPVATTTAPARVPPRAPPGAVPPPRPSPAMPRQGSSVAWPVGEQEERIAIPAPIGRIPALPPPLKVPPSAPASGNPPGAVPPPRPPGQASAPLALDPIAQIAAATQAGAAELIGRQSAVAIAVSTVAELPPAMPPPQASARAPPPSSPPSSPSSPPPPRNQPASPTPALRSLVIAIDPGHGGRDPGAIGPAGTYEKNVVLAIARELARQINATPGMQAHLIRDSDVYIELPQRAQIAREARADMFVSIHADAAENRRAHGASVYTLSTTGASSQHARWLADRENSVDLIGGIQVENSTLSSVLLDLAHSGHLKASQDAASHVLTGLSGVAKAHKTQVEYANFSVLRNADMPAMLVETGFISNPEEEKRLKNPAHQRRVASAILQGIDAFFRNQPPPGTLFAANLATRSQTRAGSTGGSP